MVLSQKQINHKIFLRNQSIKRSISRRENRLLSKSLKPVDTVKSCEYCSKDFLLNPLYALQRFHSFDCLLKFNQENFIHSVNKTFRGEDWDIQRRVAINISGGNNNVYGNMIYGDANMTSSNGLKSVVSCIGSMPRKPFNINLSVENTTSLLYGSLNGISP